MFSPAFSNGHPRFSAHLYQQVGVETGVRAASPHALTLMLFDGFLNAVKQARRALAEGRVEDKGRHVRHAGRILDEGLKASLNLNAGGELALNLRDLYDYAQVRLMQGHARNDDKALAEAQALIEPLREGWAGIAAQVTR